MDDIEFLTGGGVRVVYINGVLYRKSMLRMIVI